jgi:hypothetical protein
VAWDPDNGALTVKPLVNLFPSLGATVLRRFGRDNTAATGEPTLVIRDEPEMQFPFCAVATTDVLLVSDTNRRVLRCDRKTGEARGVFLANLPCNSDSMRLMNDDSELWLALFDDKSIQVVDVATAQTKRSIKLPCPVRNFTVCATARSSWRRLPAAQPCWMPTAGSCGKCRTPTARASTTCD